VLSDRFRWTKVVLLAAVLAALCGANYFTAPELLTSAVRDSLRHPGERTRSVQFGFTRVLEARDGGSARLLIWDREVEVRQGAAGWREGDLVSISGWLTPDGRIDVSSFTLHRARWLKKAVSLLAAVVFLGILARRAARALARRGRPCPT